MATKPLVFLHPLSERLVQLKESIEPSAESEGIEIFEPESLEEFNELSAHLGQFLIVCSNPKICARMLQVNSRTIRKSQSKAILLSTKQYPRKTMDKLNKLGLTELILESVQAKTLQYKIKLQIRSISNKTDEENDILVKNEEEVKEKEEDQKLKRSSSENTKEESLENKESKSKDEKSSEDSYKNSKDNLAQVKDPNQAFAREDSFEDQYSRNKDSQFSETLEKDMKGQVDLEPEEMDKTWAGRNTSQEQEFDTKSKNKSSYKEDALEDMHGKSEGQSEEDGNLQGGVTATENLKAHMKSTNEAVEKTKGSLNGKLNSPESNSGDFKGDVKPINEKNRSLEGEIEPEKRNSNGHMKGRNKAEFQEEKERQEKKKNLEEKLHDPHLDGRVRKEVEAQKDKKERQKSASENKEGHINGKLQKKEDEKEKEKKKSNYKEDHHGDLKGTNKREEVDAIEKKERPEKEAVLNEKSVKNQNSNLPEERDSANDPALEKVMKDEDEVDDSPALDEKHLEDNKAKDLAPRSKEKKHGTLTKNEEQSPADELNSHYKSQHENKTNNEDDSSKNNLNNNPEEKKRREKEKHASKADSFQKNKGNAKTDQIDNDPLSGNFSTEKKLDEFNNKTDDNETSLKEKKDKPEFDDAESWDSFKKQKHLDIEEEGKEKRPTSEDEEKQKKKKRLEELYALKKKLLEESEEKKKKKSQSISDDSFENGTKVKDIEDLSTQGEKERSNQENLTSKKNVREDNYNEEEIEKRSRHEREDIKLDESQLTEAERELIKTNKDWGEQTIDYKKLKAGEEGIFEDRKAEDGSSELKITEIMPDPTLESPLGKEAEDNKVFHPDSKGMESVIRMLNCYYKEDISSEAILDQLCKYINKEPGFGVPTFFYRKNGSKDFIEILNGHQMLSSNEKNEWWNSLIKSNSNTWEKEKLLKWSDKTFREKEIQFIYPFYEGIDQLGYAVVTFSNGFKKENSKRLEVILESARAVYLTKRHQESGDNAVYDQLKAPPKDEIISFKKQKEDTPSSFMGETSNLILLEKNKIQEEKKKTKNKNKKSNPIASLFKRMFG